MGWCCYGVVLLWGTVVMEPCYYGVVLLLYGGAVGRCCGAMGQCCGVKRWCYGAVLW